MTPTAIRQRRPFVAAVPLLLLAVGFAPAQGFQPAKYRVQVRYRIPAAREIHIRQYDQMLDDLEKIGFQFVPPRDQLPPTDREDRGVNRLNGILAAADVMKLFHNPNVASALLIPDGYKLPAEPEQPVKVRLELASGIPLDRQRALADQVRALLRELGWFEATGYDHRGYTGRPHSRLVGVIAVEQLETLLRDLRDQPTGWLAPGIPLENLPSPLRMTNPILLTEVLAVPEAVSAEPAPPAPREPGFLDKIGDRLWALVNQKEAQDKYERVEIILAYTPTDDAWRGDLSRVGARIEGRVGPVITALARVGDVRTLASLSIVSTVRLPRSGELPEADPPPAKADPEQVLRESGLAEKHGRGCTGKKVRLGIISGDFRGYRELVGKRLPADTRYVDLTAERNADMQPEPFPGDPKQLGRGTQQALAALLAAPEAELTLIRVDPSAPYHLQTVARYARGTAVVSFDLERRQSDLTVRAAQLQLRRSKLMEERRLLLDQFGPEKEDLKARQEMLKKLQALEADEDALRRSQRQYLDLVSSLASLRGLHVVSNTLLWNDRWALGGGPLARGLDESCPPTLWTQAVGNTRGQSWGGLFRDADGNGVMEFAPVSEQSKDGLPAPRPGRWTSELNFLSWQPFAAAGESFDIPAGTKIHLSMQWREPHDPVFFFQPGQPDAYRVPLAVLRLAVLRQHDPKGVKYPVDDLQVVARSFGLPHRLDNYPDHATYEIAVEFTAAETGRYALRVERLLPKQWILKKEDDGWRLVQIGGLVPSGIRPMGAATLEAIERDWELRPRFFVEAADEATRRKGRILFGDYRNDAGGIGTPADSRAVWTVGAASLEGRPQPYSAQGSPPNAELLTKPDLLAYDAVRMADGVSVYGTGIAAPFAAGMMAVWMQASPSRHAFFDALRRQLGKVLSVAP
jgi:hypothetical protein